MFIHTRNGYVKDIAGFSVRSWLCTRTYSSGEASQHNLHMILAYILSTRAGEFRLGLSSRLSPSRGRPLSGVDLERPSAQGSGLR